MKLKILFFILLLASLTATQVAAQKKGDILLGAYVDPLINSVDVYAPFANRESPLNLRTNFKGGYHIFNHVSAGISFAYNYSRVRNGRDNARYYRSNYLAGIFVRGVIPIRKFGLVSEFGYRLGHEKGEILEREENRGFPKIETSYSSGVRSIQGNFGINYQATPKLSVEFTVNLEVGRYKQPFYQLSEKIFDSSGFYLGVVYFISPGDKK